MTGLFTPYTLKDVTLRNRIIVAPMCQYQAQDGLPNDWHTVHYSALARGGSALVVVEATAVSPEGRITPACLGLWNDEQAAAFAPVVEGIRKAGAVPGIQLAHAGRKASANVPWEGDDHIPAQNPKSWQPIAPSPIAFGGDLNRTPEEMTLDDITRVKADFVKAAERARDAGFQWLMLHFAHGYLAQSFFSAHSNQRTDQYGGSADNRARFLIETLQAVKAVWPENLPLSIRFGVIEFDGRDEETFQDSLSLLKKLRTSGLDFLDVSIGFSTPEAKIPWGPAFMGPWARRTAEETGLPVSTSWYISEGRQADALIRTGGLDMVSLGRPLLANPHWPFEAAKAVHKTDPAFVLPSPYGWWLSRYK
ncbi:NADH:flavin oxidoreductase [Acetobacter cibinongensis]|uniref:NADH:flavin oxidoreductase n=1 Tax=Acetobacter cibinongensis TaxID=146475 RepID=A0A0D6N304_9PROT|nr:NADH:flavin oxidoreductase/NADH oxidase [Acetobacter cibinongensis]GAN59953.1 NADH:flavin oxidoreductase [Acetobacter cibinongensis]GBQ16419.1 NADH:flavin oxidoreductase [Acetobacter cibinongensis NRIC 0482]GEL57573.1 NADH:flavin oxidoreductase [Acetobacter cibinongensis]